MTTCAEIFGVIQPKPVYRTASGRFRKETPEEFRGRHDDRAWSFSEQQRIHLKAVCEHMLDPKSNPWSNLLGYASSPYKP